ncbi:MAG: copper oxidase [Chloroflexi bacterium]|nr:copper oxidase [Chloroflexota bacterium]
MQFDNLSRRNFLKVAGLAGAAAGISACAGSAPVPPTATNVTAHVESTQSQGETAEEMDNKHKERVDVFLAGIGKDPSFWGAKLPFTEVDGFKVFEVTCKDVKWEIEPGKSIDAMAYNGIVPGPEIRITEGDKVRVVVKNEMVQSTAIHFHGVLVPNSMDGVPFVTQPPIKNGETFTYEFTARNPGSHMYHSHHNAAEQVTKGLIAPFIIEPKDRSADPDYDAEYTMVLNDTGIGLTINGKSFPYTQPIVAKLGDRIRIRYMNEGLLIHPMHLHGLPQQVFSKDGWNLANPYMCDTLNVAPGERYDVLVDCTEAGAWAFHCHILTHAESAAGMFGMVTALVVQ